MFRAETEVVTRGGSLPESWDVKPVLRSSSEIVAPSAVFLDLMSLDPLPRAVPRQPNDSPPPQPARVLAPPEQPPPPPEEASPPAKRRTGPSLSSVSASTFTPPANRLSLSSDLGGHHLSSLSGISKSQATVLGQSFLAQPWVMQQSALPLAASWSPGRQPLCQPMEGRQYLPQMSATVPRLYGSAASVGSSVCSAVKPVATSVMPSPRYEGSSVLPATAVRVEAPVMSSSVILEPLVQKPGFAQQQVAMPLAACTALRPTRSRSPVGRAPQMPQSVVLPATPMQRPARSGSVEGRSLRQLPASSASVAVPASVQFTALPCAWLPTASPPTTPMRLRARSLGPSCLEAPRMMPMPGIPRVPSRRSLSQHPLEDFITEGARRMAAIAMADSGGGSVSLPALNQLNPMPVPGWPCGPPPAFAYMAAPAGYLPFVQQHLQQPWPRQARHCTVQMACAMPMGHLPRS